MNPIIETLNEKQREAVMATEGKVRIVAGAGSGKTRVIAHRYAYLVNEIGIDPGNILCMTFTNKAAREMKDRISKLVHSAHVNDFTCTIHGFCVKFLRREIHRIGYPKGFIVMDTEDAKNHAKQVLEEMHVDYKASTIKEFQKNIQKYKYESDGEVYIPKIIIPDYSLEAIEVNEVIRYIQRQHQSFALDFDDLMLFTLYIMNHFPDSLEYWQDLINYIMVDEVQDCNSHDWRIINNLSGKYNNVFVVGDPDQAIYEWRGSRPDFFMSFPAETDIILNENYRSTPNILDVANSIISHNKKRIPKDLFTQRTSNRLVIHYHGKSENEECDWIASQIEKLVKEGETYNNIAVLYRASYLSRNLEQALMKKQIKYVVWGGIRFFERKEIKDSISYLRLISNHQDDMAFRRIVNVPSRTFGSVSMKKLQELADKEKLSLYDTLVKHRLDQTFNKTAISKFLQFIDECKGYSTFTSIYDLLDYVLRGSGLEEMYRKEGDEERLDNIAELKGSIKEYESLHVEEELVSLENYLQDIALYTNADYKDDGVTVKLMTIHQAKGLEFPYVFVYGLNEGIFPSHRSIRDRRERAEEEERRLMYVAVTRAEKALFLTESEGYNFVAHMEKCPSRFLFEIKDGLLDVEGDIDPKLMKKLKSETQMQIKSISNESIPLVFSIGDKVVHKVFGVGEIIEKSSDESYKVHFEKGDRFLQSHFLTPYIPKTDGKDGGNNSEKDPEKMEQDVIPFKVGDTIYYSQYGKGKILEIEGSGRKTKLIVKFSRYKKEKEIYLYSNVAFPRINRNIKRSNIKITLTL